MRYLIPLLMLPPVAWADAPVKRLSGQAEVGYISSMGSLAGSKDTFRGKLALTHSGDYWIQIFSAEGVSVRDEIPATNDTERYLLNYKARHYWNARDFFTFRGQWEKDLLTANDYQAFVSLGLGRELLKTDRHFVKVEFGPGVRHTQALNGSSTDNAMGLFSWDYDGKLTDSARFVHKGTVEAGEDSVITRVHNQLRQDITKVVALTVSHDYRHEDSLLNKREGIFSFGLNYKF